MKMKQKLKKIKALARWSVGFAVLSAWCFLSPVQAQIYKYTDENGIINYTNIKPATNRYSIKVIGCYGTCKRKVDWHNVALNTDSYRQPLADLAKEYSVDEALLRALIHAESAFNPQATSPKGAQGLMQLMPATQSDLGVLDAYAPLENLRGGTEYLAQMLEMFENNTDYALAAYNAGPNAVKQYDGIPPYQETQEYVRRINILQNRYRRELTTNRPVSTNISASTTSSQ